MPIIVNTISHKAFPTGKSAEITLGGSWFVSPMVLIIGGQRVPCHYSNEFMAQFYLPYLAANVYDINVVNGDETTFVLRSAISITDQISGPTVGSSQNPRVMPSMIVQGRSTSSLTAASKIRNYETPASLQVSGNQTTIAKSLDPSIDKHEPVPGKINQITDSTGVVLNTPFGDFINQ